MLTATWYSANSVRAVLVLDRAGWHTAHDAAVPEGVQLAFPPAASPDLQPVEQHWPLLDEPVANRAPAAAERGVILVLMDRQRCSVRWIVRTSSTAAGAGRRMRRPYHCHAGGANYP
jgi:hypothetical protein